MASPAVATATLGQFALIDIAISVQRTFFTMTVRVETAARICIFEGFDLASKGIWILVAAISNTKCTLCRRPDDVRVDITIAVFVDVTALICNSVAVVVEVVADFWRRFAELAITQIEYHYFVESLEHVFSPFRVTAQPWPVPTLSRT